MIRLWVQRDHLLAGIAAPLHPSSLDGEVLTHREAQVKLRIVIR